MMKALTSVSELKQSVRWSHVTECTSEAGLHAFSIWPTAGKWLPQIEFVFDRQVTQLYQFNFGPWHAHFDKHGEDRNRVRAAIGMTRALMSGARCLLVQRGDGGRDGYLGSGVYRRSRLPDSLSEGFRFLERLVFNAPLERVDLDMSRYIRTRRGSYITQELKRRINDLREAGVHLPMLD